MYKYPQVLLLALSMEMHFNSDYLGWAKNVSNGPVGEGLLLLLLEPESPPNQSGAESPTQHIAVTAGICITKAMYIVQTTDGTVEVWRLIPAGK